MRSHLIALLALVPCFAQDDAVKSEFAKLDGAWQVVGHETNGKPTNEEHWRKVQFVFKGNQLTFLGNDILRKKVAKNLEGIYEIKDDRLKTCFRNDEIKNRPINFSTKQDSNLVLFVLKRDK
jgi:hypothetical protein